MADDSQLCIIAMSWSDFSCEQMFDNVLEKGKAAEGFQTLLILSFYPFRFRINGVLRGEIHCEEKRPGKDDQGLKC
jgi:hypothetical protein